MLCQRRAAHATQMYRLAANMMSRRIVCTLSSNFCASSWSPITLAASCSSFMTGLISAAEAHLWRIFTYIENVGTWGVAEYAHV